MFTITIEPVNASGSAPAQMASAPATAPSAGTPVYSTFAGLVEVVDILVKVGDTVAKGKVVAAVEAMKAKHDIKAQCDGKVTSIYVKIGDEIDNTKPIMTIS